MKHVHDTSVKIAIIAAATVLVSVLGDIYLSPLQTCIRDTDHKADWPLSQAAHQPPRF